MAPLKLLITGATGYIGGSVLSTLLKSTKPSLNNLSISALVRNEAQVKKLATLGVNSILFKDLDDSEAIKRAASEHDVVIHTASGFHPESARALILGLAERKRETGNEVYYLHTSGTSNVGDRPISGDYLEPRTFSDTKDDVYAYLKQREAVEAYKQRTTDLVVVETGKKVAVQTFILMSPTIYGFGSGAFNRQSIQLPSLMKAAMTTGKSFMIGQGEGIWDYVHIADLANLYELMLARILQQADVPSGDKGIFFTGSGQFTWKDLAASMGKAGKSLGVLETADVKSLSLQDATQVLAIGSSQVVELGFASNSRTRADFAKEILGWKPEKTAEDWEANVEAELKIIAGKGE